MRCIEFIKKIQLLFDPFITQNPLAKTVDIKKIKADYILVSHGHYDHITDTAANIQSVMLTDASNKADSGITKYRFINLIPNGSVDLYFGTLKVASNIAYKQATDTFSLAAGQTGAWSLRLAGGATTLGTTYTSTSTTVNQRVFTIYSRGYAGLATADIRSPKISFLYNK